MRDAIKRTRAWVVYACNVMTEPGETDGYSAADHLEALYRHGIAGMVDVVLVNDGPVAAGGRRRLRARRGAPRRGR